MSAPAPPPSGGATQNGGPSQSPTTGSCFTQSQGLTREAVLLAVMKTRKTTSRELGLNTGQWHARGFACKGYMNKLLLQHLHRLQGHSYVYDGINNTMLVYYR